MRYQNVGLGNGHCLGTIMKVILYDHIFLVTLRDLDPSSVKIGKFI